MLDLKQILEPSSTAILVVDMQNDYCSPDGSAAQRGQNVAPFGAMIPRLQRFLERARELHAKIIFIQVIHEDATDSDVWVARHGGKAAPSCRRGTWGAEFCGVFPLPGEPVVVKHRYSAFVGTRLSSVLRALGIRTLVMTGVATNVCVESTARDGYMRDYHIALVSDCTAASSEREHEGTLENIRNFFGAVATSDDVLSCWTNPVLQTR